jgi:dTDP-glucose 4,6-dehydratase
MKAILITGGAGFIGSNLIRYLFQHYDRYQLIVLDSLTYAGSVENLPAPVTGEFNGRLRFCYGDITNAELVDNLVAASDLVVHFAAETHVTRSIYDNSKFFQTDVIGTQTVANAVCKHKATIERFVHISSSEVYGTALSTKMDEDHPLNPMSPYAAAKAGADRLVYSYWKTYGVPAIILRPFNNYGPWQHLEKVIPRFITSTMLDENLRVHGDGRSARDFLHVRDHCKAIDRIIHSPAEKVVGEVFNVGSGQARTILSLAEDIIERMCPDRKCLINVGDRPGQVLRHTADTAKIESVLGWKPEIDWTDGLDETIDWYRTHHPWWQKQLWLREIPITTEAGNVELH